MLEQIGHEIVVALKRFETLAIKLAFFNAFCPSDNYSVSNAMVDQFLC
jgi:hypothetical protein